MHVYTHLLCIKVITSLLSSFTPAENRVDSTEKITSLSYVEPYWSGTPTEDYSLITIKNGTEIGKLCWTISHITHLDDCHSGMPLNISISCYTAI